MGQRDQHEYGELMNPKVIRCRCRINIAVRKAGRSIESSDDDVEDAGAENR